MLRKLIVHIGANKTGSSAIQRFLGANHAALRSHGVVVPDQYCRLEKSINGWQTFYFQELFGDPRGQEELEEAIRAIERQAPNVHTLLLSAENLAANPAAPQLFERLVDRYDTRVLLYVRRQDEYLLSSWQQWYSKVSSDFWAWLVANLGHEGNWQLYLKRWEEIIPRDKITVRVYERPKLAGDDVVQDYVTSLGLGRHEEFRYPEAAVNPSFNDAIVDLVVGNRFIFQDAHDNRFYKFVQEMTGDQFIKSKRSSVLTYAQRNAIITFYDSCNTWVRNAYFPETSEPLFIALREGDYVHVSQETLDKQKLEFLICMLYGMYKGRKS